MLFSLYITFGLIYSIYSLHNDKNHDKLILKFFVDMFGYPIIISKYLKNKYL